MEIRTSLNIVLEATRPRKKAAPALPPPIDKAALLARVNEVWKGLHTIHTTTWKPSAEWSSAIAANVKVAKAEHEEERAKFLDPEDPYSDIGPFDPDSAVEDAVRKTFKHTMMSPSDSEFDHMEKQYQDSHSAADDYHAGNVYSYVESSPTLSFIQKQRELAYRMGLSNPGKIEDYPKILDLCESMIDQYKMEWHMEDSELPMNYDLQNDLQRLIPVMILLLKAGSTAAL